jgi:integrase
MIIAAFEGNHYQALVKFLFWTGCRPSEAIALTWGDVDPQLQSLTFRDALVQGIGRTGNTKTGKIRRFPINEQLRSLLISLRSLGNPQPIDPVFYSSSGCLVDAHNFLNREWKPTLGRIAVSYRVAYNCRHTFITLCLEKGIPVTQIAAWVGNSPKVIWEYYAGLVSTSDVPTFDQ